MSARTEPGAPAGHARVALCADVGSTFTKLAAVDLDTGALLASASHPSTVETDVLHGLDAAIAHVTAALPSTADVSTIDVCSSAGGGLRLAVVGYEQLVTAEAGRRVALSAGARVVHTSAGRLDRVGLSALRAARPDIILLVGGTDGGDADVLRHNAARLAAARLANGRTRVPVIVAGNIEAQAAALAALTARATPVVPTRNVLPRIGQLAPGPARAAIREVFLRHVIGGKRLSRGPRFASLVRGATPDVVLTAVEVFADQIVGDLLVVDIGGATTDVYSVLTPDSASPGPASADVAGTLWRSRTVEGDLGMRWNAPGVIAAAVAERLLEPAEAETLAEAAAQRARDPGLLVVTDAERAIDARLAALAAVAAVRRHARGRDLSRVRLLIGSGGVLRHASPEHREEVLRRVLTDHAGGWALPRSATIAVDVDYVLAPAGLLAHSHPRAARALLADRLCDANHGGSEHAGRHAVEPNLGRLNR